MYLLVFFLILMAISYLDTNETLNSLRVWPAIVPIPAIRFTETENELGYNHSDKGNYRSSVRQAGN